MVLVAVLPGPPTMKRLVYSNSSLGRNVSAYVGLHVWDHQSDVLMMASIIGAEAAVRGLIAAVQGGDQVSAEQMFKGGKSFRDLLSSVLGSEPISGQKMLAMAQRLQKLIAVIRRGDKSGAEQMLVADSELREMTTALWGEEEAPRDKLIQWDRTLSNVVFWLQHGNRASAEAAVIVEPQSVSWPGFHWTTKLKTEKHAYRQTVRLVETDAKDDQGKAHGLILHKAAFDPNATFALMVNIGENGETIPEADAFWRLWLGRWSVPGMREWAGYVLEKVKSGRYAKALRVYQRPGQGVTAYKIELSDEQLGEIVAQGLKSGSLTMPDGPETDGARVDGVTDVTTYLTTFSKALAKQISHRFKPLFIPGETPRHPLMAKFEKNLYGAQADVAQAIALSMRRYQVDFISGEMGTGKTRMGSVVPYLLHNGRGYRYFVMCPPHLVLKWEREIQNMVPEAKVHVVRSLSDLLAVVASRPWSAEVPEYVIISRETMKLGTTSRPAVMMGFRPIAPGQPIGKGEHHYGPICPTCGTVLLDKEGAPMDDPFSNQKDCNRKCKCCGEVLWSAGLPGPYRGRALRRPEGFRDVENVKVLRRWPLADYIKRHLKGWADGLIVDEVHELKAADSAQGNALGALAAAVKYVLALTGTLSGGYATDLFPILYRMRPALMKAEGFEYNALNKFAQAYGRVERITKTSDEDDGPSKERNTRSKGKKSRSHVKVRPGISPMMYGRFLMPNTAFVELADLGRVLPSYHEEVELVPMEPDLAVAYQDFSSTLKAKVQELLDKGSKRLLGAYLQALLNYPDKPFDAPPVIDKATGDTVATPKPLDKRFDRNKVARLAQICRQEKLDGRKVLVYATATNLRDVQPYLREVLEANGLRVAIMYGKQVKPEKREHWIAEQVSKGIDVLICNPALVATGLDLLAFPTIAWFQTGYSTFTLRQASRRSWRIGQRAPVKVYFMAYSDTLQESCLQLMGSKLAASMGLEGRWSEEGLQALCEGEDMSSALARALVHGLDGTDSAESMWRKMMPVEPENEKGAPPASTAPEAPAAPVEAPKVVDPIPGLVAIAASAFFKRGRTKASVAAPPVKEGEAAQLAFAF